MEIESSPLLISPPIMRRDLISSSHTTTRDGDALADQSCCFTMEKISQLKTPVVTLAGSVYEHDHIKKWLQTSDQDPNTRIELKTKMVLGLGSDEINHLSPKDIRYLAKAVLSKSIPSLGPAQEEGMELTTKTVTSLSVKSVSMTKNLIKGAATTSHTKLEKVSPKHVCMRDRIWFSGRFAPGAKAQGSRNFDSESPSGSWNFVSESPSTQSSDLVIENASSFTSISAVSSSIYSSSPSSSVTFASPSTSSVTSASPSTFSPPSDLLTKSYHLIQDVTSEIVRVDLSRLTIVHATYQLLAITRSNLKQTVFIKCRFQDVFFLSCNCEGVVFIECEFTEEIAWIGCLTNKETRFVDCKWIKEGASQVNSTNKFMSADTQFLCESLFRAMNKNKKEGSPSQVFSIFIYDSSMQQTIELDPHESICYNGMMDPAVRELFYQVAAQYACENDLSYYLESLCTNHESVIISNVQSLMVRAVMKSSVNALKVLLRLTQYRGVLTPNRLRRLIELADSLHLSTPSLSPLIQLSSKMPECKTSNPPLVDLSASAPAGQRHSKTLPPRKENRHRSGDVTLNTRHTDRTDHSTPDHSTQVGAEATSVYRKVHEEYLIENQCLEVLLNADSEIITVNMIRHAKCLHTFFKVLCSPLIKIEDCSKLLYRVIITAIKSQDVSLMKTILISSYIDWAQLLSEPHVQRLYREFIEIIVPRSYGITMIDTNSNSHLIRSNYLDRSELFPSVLPIISQHSHVVEGNGVAKDNEYNIPWKTWLLTHVYTGLRSNKARDNFKMLCQAFDRHRQNLKKDIRIEESYTGEMRCDEQNKNTRAVEAELEKWSSLKRIIGIDIQL